MFTPKNYYKSIATIDFNVLPPALVKGREYVDKATDNGNDWDSYKGSETIKRVVDSYFEKLAAAVSRKPVKAVVSKPKKEKTVKPKERPVITDISMVHLVPRTADELRFIKRYVNLNEKTQTKEQILRFINSLQKAIVEKRVRKTSQWAEQIRHIQDSLVKTYNTMGAKITLMLKPETIEKFKGFVSGEKVYTSVAFIKRYIGMAEKPGMKQKASNLLRNIQTAMDKGDIPEIDPYYHEVAAIKKDLHDFVNASTKTLQIEMQTLTGLQGILSGCNCGQPSLNGVDGMSQVMNSMDFAKLQFSTIGLQGKWKDFFGDPSHGFSAMVSGRPKYGKSRLCVDFAGHLARHHGNTLFVAVEEKLNRTLQDKLDAVKHPNLTVAAFLPADLSPYEYIFLDSVTRLGLSADDLRRLKANNPGKNFIYVFQVTKGGMFRGANDFQHDVDIVVDVLERGKAVQMGRFNQGGEMDIFAAAA